MRVSMIAVATAALFIVGSARAEWRPGYGSSGFLEGSPLCAVEFEGMLAIGGDFAGAGCVQSPGVVLTDLERFYPTGNQITFRYADWRSRGVHALIVYDGQLVAGGDFGSWTGVPMQYVARLTESGWVSWGDAYGEGTLYGGPVWALAEFEGDLIAAGDFTSSRLSPDLSGIARWDGTQWQPMGDRSGARALAVWGGQLYCGMYRWNGTQWIALADMQPARAKVTVIHEVDGGLAFGGTFETLDGVQCNGTALFDGTGFRPLADGILTTDDPGFADPEVGGVGGIVSYAGRTYMQGPNYKQYQGYFGLATIAAPGTPGAGSWWPVEGLRWWNIYGNDGFLALFQDQLVVLGGRSRAEMDLPTAGALRAAILDGDQWSPLLTGLGTELAPRTVAAVDGRNWVSVPERGLLLQEGASLRRIDIEPVVRSIVEYDGQVLVAGYVEWAGHVVEQDAWLQVYGTDGVRTLSPAHWRWIPEGNDFRALVPWSGGFLAVLRSGDPYLFSTPGPGAFALTWIDPAGLPRSELLTTPITPPVPIEITAITVHEGRPWYARDGEVYRIDSAVGEPLVEELVGTFNGHVEALVSEDGRLFAGGTFSSVNARSSQNLAVFEQGDWSTTPTTDGPVHALAASGEGVVFVGGEFTRIGGAVTRNLGAIAGQTVGGFEDGPDGPVTSIAFTDDGVIVGGEFSEAGGLCADHVAAWVGDLRSVSLAGGGGTSPPVIRLRLLAPTPNPFNPRVTLAYELPRAGSVRLRIYDLAGRLVRTLEDGPRDQGRHDVIWNGTGSDGAAVASGVYVARLEADGRVLTRKLSLLR